MGRQLGTDIDRGSVERGAKSAKRDGQSDG